MTDGVLVIDVGTSNVRAAVVRADASVDHVRHAPLASRSPAPGLVEIDAGLLAESVVELATATVEAAGPVAGVGITNQRATSIVWERASGKPVGPAIGWQDLRTVVKCLELQGAGLRLAPNMSATKIAAILDEVDPDRRRAGELCAGTVDSWVAWTLAGGAASGLHVTDATNVAVTGLVRAGAGATGEEALDAATWDTRVLEALGIPAEALPAVVDTAGIVGEAAAVPGAPPICALVGDQQASLVGQGCTRPGMAKATFGSGGMLDLCTGAAPLRARRGDEGTFPIVAWRRGGVTVWGVEAILLTAGTCVEWLVDLGLITSAAESAAVAAACESTEDVWFVPALMGMGTPVWDFGARGTLVGATRGTGRPQLVRAVLEGIAHRGADLLEAAEADGGASVDELRVDGGMSANEVFVQALADACGKPIQLSAQLEATTLGAGLLAGLALGTWADTDDLALAYRPRATVEPRLDGPARSAVRERWLQARDKAVRTIPDLSGIDF